MSSKGIKSEQVRASGQLASAEEAQEELEKMDEPVAVELPDERERAFRTPLFSRMRLEWRGDDAMAVKRAHAAVDGRVLTNFADAYEVMNEVFDVVRTPETDMETGEPLKDQFGYTIWKRNPSGTYEEDWSRLTRKEKERFLFVITTRLVEWERRMNEAWIESMLAKAQFDDIFSQAFDAPMTGTVDDRRAKGNMAAQEERYFAIFLTAYSRQADSIVRTMDRLAQRIRDSL